MNELIDHLRNVGVVLSDCPEVLPLTGGVSSEIALIRDGERRMVVKRALERLCVKDEWFADTRRNLAEQAYLQYANSVSPGSVPRLLHKDADRRFFVMEYLGTGWSNWKQKLLEGHIDHWAAKVAGEVLGQIHAASWGDARVRLDFANADAFHALRIEPYLLTTGARNAALRSQFEAEADRLGSASIALIHGDFSPKNILLCDDSHRVALLDCEVASFGDPAFDVAFLVNHLCLKALHKPTWSTAYLALASSFLGAYGNAIGVRWDAELDARVARLVLMLMLARVDGKSPVEYLAGEQTKCQVVRDFVHHHLLPEKSSVATVMQLWQQTINSL